MTGAAFFKSSPLRDLVAVAIGEGAANDHDEINQCPDAEPAGSQQLDDAGADFAGVKPVDAEVAEEKAKEECGQDSFVAHDFRKRKRPDSLLSSLFKDVNAECRQAACAFSRRGICTGSG
jgi:hypothetical protein